VWTLFSPFIPTLAQLIFGGVFDRNPKLQVVFAEAGIGWVPNALQDAELVYNSYPGLHQLVPRLSPTEYWAKHCHATFQNDALGLKLIDHIGVDKVMWAVDYPHAEGSWGVSEASIQAVLDAVPPEDAKKILGGNAMRVFGL
jgi:predicted TIM-barrel fold metal-dependent hydrolase